MKLITLQTPSEEISMLNNMVYQGIMGKFHNLFIRKEQLARPTISMLNRPESSQFYKKLVELAGTGIRAKATVLYITNTGLLINRDPVISLTLRFLDTNNEMLEITAKTVVSRMAIPIAADTITIAYNPEEPGMVAVL